MAVKSGIEINDLSKEVKKGTTILSAEPFAFVLSEQHRKEKCDQCFQR